MTTLAAAKTPASILSGSRAPAPVVRLTGVERTYQGPPPVTALRPCDLAIRCGDFVTIEGPSGSGKSTLLNILGLLDRPTAGMFELDGIDTMSLRDRDRTALRGRRIGTVFQAFHLLSHRSATENVELAMLYDGTRRRERTARALDALNKVGLGHRLDALPTRLSGGERQRVAIARGMVTRPSLLLCDEPTGNLDSVTAQGVLALLEELNGDGLTIVLISHDPAIAARGRTRLRISDGVLSQLTAP